MTLKINEFFILEYPTDLLSIYKVLSFSLTNKTAIVAVFPEFYGDLFERNSLFCAIPNVK